MMDRSILLYLLLFFSSVCAYNLPEGAPCMADGYPGTCRLWKKCFTLIIDHQDKKYPPVCSFDGDELVICCTGCDMVEDVSKAVINPRGRFLWKTDQISWNKCIDYFLELPYEFKDNQKGIVGKSWNTSRNCFDVSWGIVGAAGGHDARRTEFPHMALLGYGPKMETAQYLCGGSVISERFILTAGHCISTPHDGPVTYAALGILKRSDPEHFWQRHRILKIIPHPQYKSPAKYHDIALLKTVRSIIFNQNVMPACLPKLSKEIESDLAIATGWGSLGPRTPPADTLQAVRLSEFNKRSCSGQYRRHRHLKRGYDHSIQMCYGDHKIVRDTCKGDSGGPLQIWGQIFSGQYCVIGVTSYGPECGRVGQAGMYTRVTPYIPWIENIVWK